MTQYYIYIYRDPSRLNKRGLPEEIYVGYGKNGRAFSHLRRKDYEHHFPCRLRKMAQCGVEPVIQIINVMNIDLAKFLEKCLIAVIGREDRGTGTLLNHTDGGDGVSSEDAKVSNARMHARKDENGKSIVGVKAAAKRHVVKDERGKSISGTACANTRHARKDEHGKSIAGVKAATTTHAAKDENGKSIAATKAFTKMYAIKDERGKSVVASKRGLTANSAKDENGKSLKSLRAWETRRRKAQAEELSSAVK